MFRHDKSVKQIELQKKCQDDKFFHQYYSYENNIDEIRLQRRLRDERNEIATLEEKRLKELVKVQKLAETEAKRQLELLKEKKRSEEFKDAKMRQYVRENSSEIRELESKLKMAYVSKLRATQIQEKELGKARQRAKEQEERKLLALNIETAELEDQLQNDTVALGKIKYKKELMEQLNGQREAAEEEAMIQFLKDKAMIDEIMRNILKEDQMFLEEEFMKKQRFKEEIEIFLHLQDLQRQKEKTRIEEENRRIVKYLKENDQKEKARKQAFIQRLKQVQEMQDIVYNSLDKYRKDTREEEQLRFEIEVAKSEAKEKEKEKRALEKVMRERLQLRYALNEQLKIKEDQIKAQKLEDQDFKRQMLIKLAEEAKLEQLTAQKRRLKQIEHRREVEEMIKEKQLHRERERQKQAEEMEKLKLAIQQRQLIIEEERLKLLKEHANKLLGYLPKGIITESEIEYLN